MCRRYISEFTAFCHSIHVLGEVTPRAMDAVTSLGERISARILAALLRQMGEESEALDATRLIVTDRTFQSAVPLMEQTRARATARLTPLFERGTIPVVTGFIGATEDGVTTTLGRGGSDYTAAILGDCLDADEVWTFTDVDGVMTADPRIVPDARVIPVLSYSEVGELAYFGAKVLHPRTIRPVIERGIPLWVKNTFHPEHPGTRIVRESRNTHGTVKAVTAIDHLSMVTVEGRGMMGVPGIAARTFAAVASDGTSVLMISQASSEQSICFVIPTKTAPQVIHTLEEEFSRELVRRDIDRIWSLDDVVVVTAVGAGMRGTPGVSARIFGSLGRAGINVIAIAQAHQSAVSPSSSPRPKRKRLYAGFTRRLSTNEKQDPCRCSRRHRRGRAAVRQAPFRSSPVRGNGARRLGAQRRTSLQRCLSMGYTWGSAPFLG